MNKITLIGNLGRDPEMNYTPNGIPVTHFTLAVKRTVNKASTGERQEEIDWFNVTFFNQLAETSNAFLKKGHKVYIEGRLQLRRFADQTTGIERTVVDVLGSNLGMLTPKGLPSSEDGYLNEADENLAMNKITLIGNLGRDPEMAFTTSSKAVTRFSLAVNRVSKSATGERQEETDWFNITFFERLAEISNQYLKKGHKAFIEGRLQLRKYIDRTGVERTAIDVVGTDLAMLTPKM
jgi:single-strand DNA-binding protein